MTFDQYKNITIIALTLSDFCDRIGASGKAGIRIL